MAKTVAVGVQDFEKIVSNGYFYIDKTNFIKEWWESADEVTLITRPRRFGKTLNMNMVERFWSIKYKGQGKIFENLIRNLFNNTFKTNPFLERRNHKGEQGVYVFRFV